MPSPLSITKADIVALKQARTFNDSDVTLWGLLIDKTPGNPGQTINTGDFKTNWGVDDDTISRVLATLERQKLIKTAVAPFTITWSGSPTTVMTAAELRAQRTAGVIDDMTTYVYYSLLLSKGASATQTVDPAAFLANWNISQTDLVSEINAFASKDTPPFTVDYPSIAITWLVSLGNS